MDTPTWDFIISRIRTMTEAELNTLQLFINTVGGKDLPFTLKED